VRDRQALFTNWKQSKGAVTFALIPFCVAHSLQIQHLLCRQSVGFFGGDSVLIADHRSALNFKLVQVVEEIGVPGGI
jgi:hypothetical protein